MDPATMTRKPWRLAMPGGLSERLHNHLFPGDGDEHGAVIGAGLADTPAGIRLLARELHLARDGIDYVPGKRGYRMLRAAFIRDRVTRCRDEKLVHIAVHNHGGHGAVAFSPDDLASHERGYPALLDIARGMPVGALVFAEGAVAGDIWLPGGVRVPLASATIIGNRRQVIGPRAARTDLPHDTVFDRQTRLFGDAGQAILGQATVAIIGLGGVGSLLAEYLVHLGVARFLLIDPDRIAAHNLPRVVGARRWDTRPFLRARWYPDALHHLADRWAARKVDISARLIRRIRPKAEIVRLARDMVDASVAQQLLDCDYMFLAADSMRVRLLFNQIVHQYYVPGIQIGSKVSSDPASGETTSIFSIVRPVTPECGCLWCNQVINPAKLQEEGQTEGERRAQRYVDEPEVVAPSVITLNAIGAAHAANEFMFYMTGLTETAAPRGYLRFMPASRRAVLVTPRRGDDCTECGDGSRSRLGRGSGRSLTVQK